MMGKEKVGVLALLHGFSQCRGEAKPYWIFGEIDCNNYVCYAMVEGEGEMTKKSEGFPVLLEVRDTH